MYEQLIKRYFEKHDRQREKTDCPDAESLALYLENRLEKRQRQMMEKHFVTCETCLEEVIVCAALKKEERVKEAIKGPVEVVVKFLKRTVEIISDLEAITVLPPPVQVVIRGSLQPIPPTARFNMDLDEMTVEIAVTKTNGETGEIRINTYKDNKPLDKIRISLLSGDKEMASYLTKKGQVNFDYDRMGNYLIRLSKNRFYLGEIYLMLRDN